MERKRLTTPLYPLSQAKMIRASLTPQEQQFSIEVGNILRQGRGMLTKSLIQSVNSDHTQDASYNPHHTVNTPLDHLVEGWIVAMVSDIAKNDSN